MVFAGNKLWAGILNELPIIGFEFNKEPSNAFTQYEHAQAIKQMWISMTFAIVEEERLGTKSDFMDFSK